MGLSYLWPDYSFPADDAESAMAGIINLVAQLEDDRDTDVYEVNPFDPTPIDGFVQEPIYDNGDTNILWPPFFKH